MVLVRTSFKPRYLTFVDHGLVPGQSYASPEILEFAELVRDVHPGLFVHSVYLDEDLDADLRNSFVRRDVCFYVKYELTCERATDGERE